MRILLGGRSKAILQSADRWRSAAAAAERPADRSCEIPLCVILVACHHVKGKIQLELRCHATIGTLLEIDRERERIERVCFTFHFFLLLTLSHKSAAMLSLKSLLLKAKSPPLQASGGDEASGGDVADDSPKKQPQKEEKAPAQPEPHIKALSDDILRLLLKCLPPKETSSLLRSCKSLAKLADDAWKTKLHAMRDDYVIAYKDIKAPSTPAHHHRVELQKRYRRLNCYRPNIERWGEEPYWYANHPCEASPFNAVRRSHDVTDFRLSVRSNRLEKGRYRAYWRVNSTSGFCVLQLDTETYSALPGGMAGGASVANLSHDEMLSSLFNADQTASWRRSRSSRRISMTPPRRSWNTVSVLPS